MGKLLRFYIASCLQELFFLSKGGGGYTYWAAGYSSSNPNPILMESCDAGGVGVGRKVASAGTQSLLILLATSLPIFMSPFMLYRPRSSVTKAFSLSVSAVSTGSHRERQSERTTG
jgi:hypothetical protein